MEEAERKGLKRAPRGTLKDEKGKRDREKKKAHGGIPPSARKEEGG